MLGKAIFSRTRAAVGRFFSATEGNIAVLFTLAAVPIISFVGVAVDYSRVNNARSSMQSALDSTVLMVSKDLTSGTITTSQIGTQAQAYFSALYTNPDAKSVTVTASYTAASGSNSSTIQINGSGSINTDFMKLMGFPNMKFGVSSTSTWGINRMRVAMALDNTGSMAANGKIGALRTAASNLVDQLSALAKNPGDVYISVVPFAKDVNVGASNFAANWIDWTDWNAANGTCSRNWYTNQASCVSAGKTWTPANHNTWTGCVTDRTQPYDTQSTAPTSTNVATLFPAEEYYENGQSYCKPGNNPPLQQIMPLSYDWSSIKTMINAMQPTGGTNQPIGIAWAWQSLQSIAPLNAPAEDPNYNYTRAIIILSDGLNTEDRWPSYGDGSTQFGGQIDARQKILCDNIKNTIDPKTGKPAYTIYTIQVNTGTPADPTSPVLQYCASNPGQFFLVTTASQVLTVFNTIGTQLSKLRVSK
ncbi:pilus assembly protein TadG [Bradyrhizobium macuxiense]|uniref:Pilus assembly protein TadG n=1 Tax=Bradyrhizobium macuxiense TaxID=1755647 RepID=A0A109JD98_9BRAD|nr:TadE/TadG family type IV pilus assembly protein [Bradyrhizobium macuxiense]KWV46809.1 pilus assembly protein TadG [Bradyrhizobium macuxiense]